MNGCRFEKAVLSDFNFAVQMSPKSNCIWTADNRMVGRSLLFLSFNACCQGRQSFLIPKHALHEGKEPSERSFPSAKPGIETQQIREQCGPYLPFNGILAGSEEICQLKCLLDFLEKHLDSPSCAVQFANGTGRPFELIREKLHETRFAVLQDTCRNHPKFIRILFAGGFFCKFYPAITQNDRLLSHKNSRLIHVPGLLYFFFAQLLSHNVETHVVLGASNPNHASVMQMMQMGKVHVGFVENDDFSGANRLAKSLRHFRIGVLGPVHDGKIRKK